MRTPAAFLAIALLGAAATAARAEDEGQRFAKVTYVSGATVYFDAGSEDGLAVGDAVDLMREGAAVARLKVTYVTSRKATCTKDGAGPDVRVGDTLRFTSRPAFVGEPPGAAAAAAAPRRSSGDSAFRRAGLRGRIGVRYLWVKDRSEIGQSFSQPSLDLLLAGTQVGGAPVDLNIDVRSRRTYRTPTGGASSDEGVDHIYQANVAWRGGPFRLALGRQVAPTLAVVSLFDGLVADFRKDGWSAGLLAGTQPDPASYSFSSDVRQYGAYGGYSSDPAKPTRWHVGLGAISSTESGEINRDFAYVEARVTHPIVGAYLQQQIDINRGWRKDAEGGSTTPSATFVMLHVRPADGWSVDGGYDSRRNVFLYRDLVTPVTTFDDATRQGYWLGAAWRPRGRWLVGLDGRRSTGGSAGTATAYTLRLGALNMSRAGIDVNLRATQYSGELAEGTLAFVSGSIDLGSRVRLDLHGGLRKDRGLLAVSEDETIDWLGTMLDVFLAHRIYFNLSYDVTRGGEEDNDQLYASFSWRF